MNNTFIKYVEQIIDFSERNDVFSLTSREFNDFLVEVREALEKQIPEKVEVEVSETGGAQYNCQICWGFVGYLNKYCENCGQKLDWEE